MKFRILIYPTSIAYYTVTLLTYKQHKPSLITVLPYWAIALHDKRIADLIKRQIINVIQTEMD